MRDSLTAWFASRSRRERHLILVMLALAALVLVWLLVLRPLGDALSAARERHGAAVIALAEARAQAEAIGRLERVRPAALEEPLAALVGRSAGEAGFQLSRLEPQGERVVTLAMEAARPQAFFAWVDGLERGRGLVVERLSATANSDRTLSVQLSLRAREG
jgi:general secretion pathway protein M